MALPMVGRVVVACRRRPAMCAQSISWALRAASCRSQLGASRPEGGIQTRTRLCRSNGANLRRRFLGFQDVAEPEQKCCFDAVTAPS